MRCSISHGSRKITSKAFVPTTRPSFYALVLVTVLVKLLSLTCSSSLEELNRTEGIPFFGIENATPIDALVLKNCVLVKFLH